eukprot:scaffold17.g522.t1
MWVKATCATAEALLESLELRPASWAELGGPQVVGGAGEAGAPEVLQALWEACQDSRYEGAFGQLALVSSYLRAGMVERSVSTVEEAADQGWQELVGGPQQEQGKELWRVLGEMCAAAAAPGQEETLLSRALDASLAMARRHSRADDDGRLAWQAIVIAALEAAAASIDAASSLPAMARELAAAPGWPSAAAEAAFHAMLAAGLVEQAAALLGPLACGSLAARSGGKGRGLFKQGSFAEALAAASEVLDVGQPSGCFGEGLVWLAALCEARLGRAEQALAFAAGREPELLADVEEALLESGQELHLTKQAVVLLLEACVACKRPTTARQLYRWALGAEASGGSSLGPACHAMALRALLLQCSPRSGGGVESQTAALADAALLQQTHGQALISLPDVGLLAGATCAAAVNAIRNLQQQRGQPACAVIRVVAEALASSGGKAAEEEQERRLFVCLEPGTQLTLWGLRLLGKDAAEQQRARLGAAASALAARGSSSQLMAFLLLAPSWGGPACAPAPAQWEAVLHCARWDDAVGIERWRVSSTQSLATLHALAWVCDLLRAAGPRWAEQLSSPSQVTALLVADARDDSAAALEVLEALAAGKAISKEDVPLVNGCCSRLLEALFLSALDSSAGAESQQGRGSGQLQAAAAAPQPDLAQYGRVVEVWCMLSRVQHKSVPLTPQTCEALAVVRMLCLQEYGAGWKALCEMAQEWGRPPSTRALLVTLHGLAQQLGELPAPEQLQETAARAVLDLAAASGTWQRARGSEAAAGVPLPALDAELGAAALRLLLATHAAHAAAGAGGPSPLQGRTLVLVLEGLASSQVHLGPVLRSLVRDAAQASVSEKNNRWPRAEDITSLGLRWQQGQQQSQDADDGEEEDEDEEGEQGSGPVDAELVFVDEWRAARYKEARGLVEFDDLRKHLAKYGWELKRARGLAPCMQNQKTHFKWVLYEEGLPSSRPRIFVFSRTTSDSRAIQNARSLLCSIYRDLEREHQRGVAAAVSSADSAA